jgi:hypothetical protein
MRHEDDVVLPAVPRILVLVAVPFAGVPRVFPLFVPRLVWVRMLLVPPLARVRPVIPLTFVLLLASSSVNEGVVEETHREDATVGNTGIASNVPVVLVLDRNLFAVMRQVVCGPPKAASLSKEKPVEKNCLTKVNGKVVILAQLANLVSELVQDVSLLLGRHLAGENELFLSIAVDLHDARIDLVETDLGGAKLCFHGESVKQILTFAKL